MLAVQGGWHEASALIHFVDVADLHKLVFNYNLSLSAGGIPVRVERQGRASLHRSPCLQSWCWLCCGVGSVTFGVTRTVLMLGCALFCLSLGGARHTVRRLSRPPVTWSRPVFELINGCDF